MTVYLLIVHPTILRRSHNIFCAPAIVQSYSGRSFDWNWSPELAKASSLGRRQIEQERRPKLRSRWTNSQNRVKFERSTGASILEDAKKEREQIGDWKNVSWDDSSPGVDCVVLSDSELAIRVAAKSAQGEELMRGELDRMSKPPGFE
jgi:hypothetical protein